MDIDLTVPGYYVDLMRRLCELTHMSLFSLTDHSRMTVYLNCQRNFVYISDLECAKMSLCYVRVYVTTPVDSICKLMLNHILGKTLDLSKRYGSFVCPSSIEELELVLAAAGV